MYYFNANKLRGAIVERGLTVSDLAEKLEMTPSTLYRKMANDGDTMLVKDANRIVAELGLTASDAIAIFFASLVA